MRRSALVLMLLIFNLHMIGQVIISTDRAVPDSSAILEISSHNKGFLPPRMTLLERTTIKNPAEGLMVYCTDCGPNGTPAVSVFMMGAWRNLINCLASSSPASSTHYPNHAEIIWNWHPVPGATGYCWSRSQDTLLVNLGPDTTYTEYNLNCGSAYTRFVWSYNECGISLPSAIIDSTSDEPPPESVAAVHIPALTQITWKWEHITHAAGYKWNTLNDFESATDLGSDTSYVETGLTCDSLYTRYVWAYNVCGNSEGTALIQSTTFDTTASPLQGEHVATSSQITWNWGQVTGATGYKWNTSGDYQSATDLGLMTNYTESGLDCSTEYTRFIWSYDDCGHSLAVPVSYATLQIPIANSPGEAGHDSTLTSILWKWHTLGDTCGYKWGTTNNYNTAIDLGTDTTHLETNLVCNTDYTRYVWAYDDCGSSVSPTIITQSTAYCWTCGDTLYVNHISGNVAPVSKTTTYGTITGLPGAENKCWITSNLGSNHQASAVDDNTEASAGWYWQFNRMQGYMHDGSARTPNTAWIGSIDEYSNWISANDPCVLELGSGWRLPTSTEYNSIDVAGNWTSWNGPWNSLLKMHASGRLDYYTGNLDSRGTRGFFWSGTQTTYSFQAHDLNFAFNSCGMGSHQKSFAFTIRCLKD